MKSVSLRWRVILASVLTLLVFFSLAGVGLQKAYNDSLDNAAESELRAYMLSLLGAMDIDEQDKFDFYGLPVSAFSQPNSGVYAEVWKSDQLLWRSDSLIGKSLPKVESTLGEYQLYSAIDAIKKAEKLGRTADLNGANMVANTNLNILSFLVDWNDGDISHNLSLVVANNAQSYVQRQNKYKESLLAWLFGLGAFLVILQMLLFKWLFMPIVKVRSELGRIQSGKQADFLGEYPREVSVLTQSLNELLSSERTQIKRVKHSLANLAHSLKTPLAAIRGGLSDNEINTQLLEQQVDRIASVVDYQLNKTSSSIRPNYRQAHPCFEPIQRLVSVMQKLQGVNGVSVSCKMPQEVQFFGDVDDLIEVVGNLMENACKWASSAVILSVDNTQNNKLAISVVDDGPGVPKDRMDDILNRGKRLDEAVEGQGIGLAMVKDIVDSYAGELRMDVSTIHQADFRSGLAVLVVI